jgi:TonB family protein
VKQGDPRLALAGRYDVLFAAGPHRQIVCSLDLLPGVFNQVMVDWEISEAWVNYHPLGAQLALRPTWDEPDSTMEWPEIGRPPRCSKRTSPEYPPLARRRFLEGVVFLDVGVAESGDIMALKVAHGVPGLNEAARDCVRQWQFEPAVYRGQPVPARIFVPVRFALH